MHQPRMFWFLRRSNITSEVDEELQLHFDMRVAELVGEGMPADEARRIALRNSCTFFLLVRWRWL